MAGKTPQIRADGESVQYKLLSYLLWMVLDCAHCGVSQESTYPESWVFFAVKARNKHFVTVFLDEDRRQLWNFPSFTQQDLVTQEIATSTEETWPLSE